MDMDIHVAAELLLARLIVAAPNALIALAIRNSRYTLVPVIEKFFHDNLDALVKELDGPHELSCPCLACAEWREKLERWTAGRAMI